MGVSVRQLVAVAAALCVSPTGSYQVSSYPGGIDPDAPTWRYQCVPSKGCQRVSAAAAAAATHASVDVCHASCGEFGGLWPRPTTAALSPLTLMFHPNKLRFNVNTAPLEVRELLLEMTAALTNNLLAECQGNVTTDPDTMAIVNINIASPDLTLNWETDESYSLLLQSKDKHKHEIVVDIASTTVYGARHGLETLSQLVSANFTLIGDQKQCGLNILTRAEITDKPVFAHRGLLLDTSRNFLSIESIKRTIDGMASSKMNLLHWHATDSHSFPLQSTRVPLLTKYGAYSESQVYSVQQIKELLHYGRVRGVRTVLEIDSPAHAGNGWQWGKEYGLGDLAVCVNAHPWRGLCIQPPCGQFNPANPNLYKVLRDLYRDIIELWPSGELFHMGGDEVLMNCWNSTKEITDYMARSGMARDTEGFMELWAEFHKKILNVWDTESRAAGGGKLSPVMVWSSELTQPNRIQHSFDKNRYVIEVWEPVESNLLHNLVSLGYRVVSVPKNIWYLDHGFWGETRYSNWRKMYLHKLHRDAGVLGGEVAMWSEYVDASDLDARIWPRAAAVAERLWADPADPISQAEARMQRHRARLVSRGVRADVLTPLWCAQHDNKC